MNPNNKKKNTKTTEPAKVAPTTMPVAAPVAAKPVTTPVAPVAAKPVTTPVAPVTTKPVTTPAPAAMRQDEPMVRTPQGVSPVVIQLKKNGTDQVKATIRYVGPLAKKAEKVVAVMGVERFGCPRWEDTRDVEMKKANDGVFEAEVALPGTDAHGKALMALQLAFTTPTRANWDSAGSPYGYYQVSTLTGSVENIAQA